MTIAPDETIDATYTTSLKGDGGAPWIVVRSDSAQQHVLDLTALDAELLALIGRVNSHLAEAYRYTQQPQQSAGANANPGWHGANPLPQNQQPGQQAQPQGFVGTPHPEGKTCPKCYAPIVGKEITSTKGGTPKTYRLWSCPNNQAKNDGHYQEWLK